MKRRALALLLSTAMALSLAGCGGRPGTTDHDMPENENWDTTVYDPGGAGPATDYNQINPDIPSDAPETTDPADPANGLVVNGNEPKLDERGPGQTGTGPASSQDPGQEPGDVSIPDEGQAPSGQPDGTEDPGGATTSAPEPGTSSEPQVPAGPVEIPTLVIPTEANVTTEIQTMSHAVPLSSGFEVSAPGTKRQSNDYAWIDYSNASQGYVVVNYTASTSVRLKCIVKGPSTSYNYNLTQGKDEVLPLSDGNGTYTITVYQNVTGTKYASVISVTENMVMENQFAPFLHSNQYVDFAAAELTKQTAAQLCDGKASNLDKVAAVYDFVVKNIGYDLGKAKSVQSGYLPVLDTVLTNRTGICFDYAALMAGMLRSQGVPCKLVVGYAGTAYHAWISVWTEDSGWVEGVVFFDGISWQRMDPTFDSSGGGSASVREFIGNGANYQTKYLY